MSTSDPAIIDGRVDYGHVSDGDRGFLPVVMPQLYQMISGLQIPKITCVHTAERETISIHEALEKAVMPDKMKLILKARTQMVESMYKYFDSQLYTECI